MKRRLLWSLFIFQLGALIPRCESLVSSLEPRVAPSPIVVAASQDWDGNDGLWSSFAIQVGTPPQNVKVLISTSGYETSAIIQGGCVPADTDCEKDRGGHIFMPNASSTWVKNIANLSTNIYPISIDERLGYNGKASLGFDDVTLGWQGSGGPTLNNQTVAGFIYGDFRLGFFGLTPRAANFTSFDDPIPSYMQNLVNQSLIPSTSWSYTAGNQYRLNEVLGSLVLGGYDSSKFIPNDVSFPFNSEDARDLTLQLEAITMADSTTTISLLPTSIPAFVDSSQPSIWLPIEACALFEKAFNLTWNEEKELYLLTGTQHSALLAQNPNVTFTLGNLTAGSNVNITLPYAAFDLNVSFPIVENSTSYFPLKRAANDTQYTLGRTFFQEAYVTADYDRGNFSVSQCSWVPNAQQNIVSILKPDTNTSSSDSGDTTKSKSINSVPIGAIAGGAIGGVVLLGAAGFMAYWFCIKPRRRRAESEAAAARAAERQPGRTSPPDPTLKPELDSEEVRRVLEMEADKKQWLVEADAQQARIYEMEGKKVVYEMDGKRGIWAVEADGTPIEIHEMPAREEVAVEMRGSRDSIEVARPGPRWSWEMTDPVQSPATLPSPGGSTIPEESPQISESSPRSFRARLARQK